LLQAENAGSRVVHGQQVLERLAADIDMRLRLVYEMVSLARGSQGPGQGE